MTTKEKDMLYKYFLFELTRLEDDVTRLQQALRYRRVDSLDCLELALALERLLCFKDFTKNVRYILRLDDCKTI